MTLSGSDPSAEQVSVTILPSRIYSLSEEVTIEVMEGSSEKERNEWVSK